MKRRKLFLSTFFIAGAAALFGLAACSGNMPDVEPPEVEELTDQEKMIDALFSMTNFDADLEMEIEGDKDTYTVEGTLQASMNSLEDIKFRADLDVDLSIDTFTVNATYLDDTVYLSLNNKRLKMYTDDLGEIINVFTEQVEGDDEEEKEKSITSLTSLHLKEIVSHISTMTAERTDTGFKYALETTEDYPDLILTSDANYKLTSMSMKDIELNDYYVSFKLDITHLDSESAQRIISPETEQTPYINITNYIGAMKQVKKIINEQKVGLNYDLSLAHRVENEGDTYLGKTTGFASIDLKDFEANIDGIIYIDDPATEELDDYNTTYSAQYFDECIYLNYSDLYLLKYSNQGLADLFTVLGDEDVFGISIFDLLFGASDKPFPILDILSDGTYGKMYDYVKEATLTENYLEIILDNSLDRGDGEGILRASIDKDAGITKLEIINLDINTYVVNGTLSLGEYKPYERYNPEDFDSLDGLDGLVKGLGKLYKSTSLGMDIAATVTNAKDEKLTANISMQTSLRGATVEQRITDLANIKALDLALKADINDFSSNKHQLILETYTDDSDKANPKDYLCASYNGTEQANKAARVKAEYNAIEDIYNVVMDYLAANSSDTEGESKLPIIGDASIKTIEKMMSGDTFAILRDEIIKSIHTASSENKDVFTIVIDKDALNLGKDLSVAITCENDAITNVKVGTKYDQYDIELALDLKAYDSELSYLENKEAIRDISDVSNIFTYLTGEPLKQKFAVLDQVMKIVNDKEVGLSLFFDVSKGDDKLIILKEGTANLKLLEDADMNDILNYLDVVMGGTLMNGAGDKTVPFELALQNGVASMSLRDENKLTLKCGVNEINTVIQEVSELFNTDALDGLNNNTNEALLPILELINEKDYAAILDMYKGSTISTDNVLEITLSNDLFNKGDTSEFNINIKIHDAGISYIEVKGISYGGYTLNARLGIEKYTHKDVDVSNYNDLNKVLNVVEQLKEIIDEKKAAVTLSGSYGDFELEMNVQGDLSGETPLCTGDVTVKQKISGDAEEVQYNEYKLKITADGENVYITYGEDALRASLSYESINNIVDAIKDLLGVDFSSVTGSSSGEQSSGISIEDAVFGDLIKELTIDEEKLTLVVNGSSFSLGDEVKAVLNFNEKGELSSVEASFKFNDEDAYIKATINEYDAEIDYKQADADKFYDISFLGDKEVLSYLLMKEKDTNKLVVLEQVMDLLNKKEVGLSINLTLTQGEETLIAIEDGVINLKLNEDEAKDLIHNLDVDFEGKLTNGKTGDEKLVASFLLGLKEGTISLDYKDVLKLCVNYDNLNAIINKAMALINNEEAGEQSSESLFPVMDMLSEGNYQAILESIKGLKAVDGKLVLTLDNALLDKKATNNFEVSLTITDTSGITELGITNLKYGEYGLSATLGIQAHADKTILLTDYIALDNIAQDGALLDQVKELLTNKKERLDVDVTYGDYKIKGTIQADLNGNLFAFDVKVTIGSSQEYRLYLENDANTYYIILADSLHEDDVRMQLASTNVKRIIDSVMRMMNDENSVLNSLISSFMGDSSESAQKSLIDYLFVDYVKNIVLRNNDTLLEVTINGEALDLADDIKASLTLKDHRLESLNVTTEFNDNDLNASMTLKGYSDSYHAVTTMMKREGTWIKATTLDSTSMSIADVVEYVESLDKDDQKAVIDQFKKLTDEQKTNLGLVVRAYQNNNLLGSTDLEASVNLKDMIFDVNGKVIIPVENEEDFEKDIRLTFIDNALYLMYGDGVKVSVSTDEISYLVSTIMKLLPGDDNATTNAVDAVLPIIQHINDGKYLSLLNYYKGVTVIGDEITFMLDNSLIGGSGTAKVAVTLGDKGIEKLSIINASYRDYALDIELTLKDYKAMEELDKDAYSSLGNLADLIANANDLYLGKKFALNIDSLKFTNQNEQTLTATGALQLDLNGLTGGANLVVNDFNNHSHAIKLESFEENEENRLYVNYTYDTAEPVKVHASYQSIKTIYEDAMKYLNGEGGDSQASLLETIASFLGGAHGTTLEKIINGQYLALITDDAFKSFSIDEEGTYHILISDVALGTDDDILIDIGTETKEEKQVLKSLSFKGGYNNMSLDMQVSLADYVEGELGYITSKSEYTPVDKVSELIDAIMDKTDDDGQLTLIKQFTTLLENKEIGVTLNATLKQDGNVLFSISKGQLNGKIANAPEYSKESTYAVGAFVTYEGTVYQCKTAVNPAEEFDADKWEEASLVDRLNATISAQLSEVDIKDIANYDKTATYQVGDLVYYVDKYYKCSTAIAVAEEFNKDHWTAAALADIADVNNYNAEATYEVGAYVNQAGKVYKCKTAIENAEAFDANKWTEVTSLPLPFKAGYTDIESVKMIYLRLNEAIKVKCDKDSIFTIIDAINDIMSGEDKDDKQEETTSGFSLTIPALEYFRNGEYQKLLKAIEGIEIAGDTMNEITIVLSNSLFTEGATGSCSLVITLDDDGIASMKLEGLQYQSYTLDFDLNLEDYDGSIVPTTTELNTYVDGSVLVDTAKDISDIIKNKQGHFEINGRYGDPLTDDEYYDILADVQGDLSDKDAPKYTADVTLTRHTATGEQEFNLVLTGNGTNLYINYGEDELKAYLNYDSVNNIIDEVKKLLGFGNEEEPSEQSSGLSLDIRELIFGDLIEKLSFDDSDANINKLILEANGSSFNLGDIKATINLDKTNKLQSVDADLELNEKAVNVSIALKEYNKDNSVYNVTGANQYYDISFLGDEDVLQYLLMKKKDSKTDLVVLNQVFDLLEKQEVRLTLEVNVTDGENTIFTINEDSGLDLKLKAAPAYDKDENYLVGDFVTVDGVTYKCKEATTGEFDANKWEEATLIERIDAVLAAELGDGNTATADLLLALRSNIVYVNFNDKLKISADYDNLMSIIEKFSSLANNDNKDNENKGDSLFPLLDLLGEKNYQAILESIRGLEVVDDKLVLSLSNSLFDKKAENNFNIELTINNVDGIKSLALTDLKYGKYALEATLGIESYPAVTPDIGTGYDPIDDIAKDGGAVDQIKDLLTNKQAHFNIEGSYGTNNIDFEGEIYGDLSGETPKYTANIEVTRHTETGNQVFNLVLTGDGTNLYINYGEDKLRAYLDYESVDNLLDAVMKAMGLKEDEPEATAQNENEEDEGFSLPFDLHDLIFGDLLTSVDFVEDEFKKELTVIVNGTSFNLGETVKLVINYSDDERISKVAVNLSLVDNEKVPPVETPVNVTIDLVEPYVPVAYKVTNADKYFDISFLGDKDVLGKLLTQNDKNEFVLINQVLDLLDSKKTGLSIDMIIMEGEKSILTIDDATLNFLLGNDDMKDFIHNLDLDLTADIAHNEEIIKLIAGLKNGTISLEVENDENYTTEGSLKLKLDYDEEKINAIMAKINELIAALNKKEQPADPENKQEALLPIMDLLEAKNYQAILESITGLEVVDGKLVLKVSNALFDKKHTQDVEIALIINEDGIAELDLSSLKYGNYTLEAELTLVDHTPVVIDSSSYIPLDNLAKDGGLFDQLIDIIENESAALTISDLVISDYTIPASEYDDSATYALGDLVSYKGVVYKCVTAISEAEAFNISKWVKATEEDREYAPEYSASATYKVGDYVKYNGHMYECKTAITVGEAFNANKWTDQSMVINGYIQAKLDGFKYEKGKALTSLPLFGANITIAQGETTHNLKLEYTGEVLYITYATSSITTSAQVYMNNTSIIDMANTLLNMLGDKDSLLYEYVGQFIGDMFMAPEESSSEQEQEQEQEEQESFDILKFVFMNYLKDVTYNSSTHNIELLVNKEALKDFLELYEDPTLGITFTGSSSKLNSIYADAMLSFHNQVSGTLTLGTYNDSYPFFTANEKLLTNRVNLNTLSTAVSYLNNVGYTEDQEVILSKDVQKAMIDQITDLMDSKVVGMTYGITVSKEKGGVSAIEIVDGVLDASLEHLSLEEINQAKIGISGRVKRPLADNGILYCPFDIRLIDGTAYISFQHGTTDPIKAMYDIDKLNDLKALLYEEAANNPTLLAFLNNLFPDDSENASDLSKALASGDWFSLLKYFKGFYEKDGALYISFDGKMIGSKDASIDIGFDTDRNGIRSIYVTDFYAMGYYLSGSVTFRPEGYKAPSVPSDVIEYADLGRVNDIAKDLIKLFGEDYQKIAYSLTGHFGDMLIDATTQFELNTTKSVNDKTDSNKAKPMQVNDGSINVTISSGKKTHYIDADLTAVLYDLSGTDYRANKNALRPLEDEYKPLEDEYNSIMKELKGIPEEDWPADKVARLAELRAEMEPLEIKMKPYQDAMAEVEEVAYRNSNINFAYGDSTSTYDSEEKATAHGSRPSASNMMYGSLNLGTVFDVVGLVQEVTSGENARFANMMSIFSSDAAESIFGKILSGDIEAFIDNKIIKQLTFADDTYTIVLNGDIFKIDPEDETEDFTIVLGTELKSGSTTDYRIKSLKVDGNYQGTDIDLTLTTKAWEDDYSPSVSVPSGKTMYEFSELKDLAEHLLDTVQLNDFVLTGTMLLNIKFLTYNEKFGTNDGYVDVKANVHIENDPWGYENTTGLIEFSEIKSVRGGWLNPIHFSEDNWSDRTFNIYIENIVVYEDLPEGQYAKDENGEYILDKDGNKLNYQPKLKENGDVVRDTNVCMEVLYTRDGVQAYKRTTRSLGEFLGNIGYYIFNYGIGLKRQCVGQGTDMWSGGDASTHTPTYSTLLQSYSFDSDETEWVAKIDIADLLGNDLLGPATVTIDGGNYSNSNNEVIKLIELIAAELDIKALGMNIGHVGLALALNYPASIDQQLIDDIHAYVQANKNTKGDYKNVTSSEGGAESEKWLALDRRDATEGYVEEDI